MGPSFLRTKGLASLVIVIKTNVKSTEQCTGRSALPYQNKHFERLPSKRATCINIKQASERAVITRRATRSRRISRHVIAQSRRISRHGIARGLGVQSRQQDHLLKLKDLQKKNGSASRDIPEHSKLQFAWPGDPGRLTLQELLRQTVMRPLGD